MLPDALVQVDTTVLGLTPEEAAAKPYIASMGIYVFKKGVLGECSLLASILILTTSSRLGSATACNSAAVEQGLQSSCCLGQRGLHAVANQSRKSTAYRC